MLAPPVDAPKKSNTLGLVALILAGLGFVLAVIPATAGFAWLLTLPALIVGIVGVTRKGQRKGTSIAALVLSTVAWLIAIIVTLATVVGGVSSAIEDSQDESAVVAEEPVVEAPVVEEETEAVVEAPAEPTLTLAQQNAVRSAESYLSFMAFSFPGLVSQLEYEGYTTDEATFAVNSLAVDWNDQAAKSAKSYLDTMAFSRQELVDQLIFEGFTPEQAEFGVVAVGY